MDRRKFLAAGALAGLAATEAQGSARLSGIHSASIRGSIDAAEFGVRPGAFDDQSVAFNALLRAAQEQKVAVYMPAGDYTVSNISLPKEVRISGIPGATRIVYGGDGYLFAGDDCEIVMMDGVHLDGANRWIGDHAQGLIDLRRAVNIGIDNCLITGSSKNGISLERCGGRIERSTISGASDVAIYSVESKGLQISGNIVADCANGGILIHRWQSGDDGSLVLNNRIERISATQGGTGQFGNGINLFRANNVMVSGNIVSDCAFSAIRANSASNIQIISNNCMRSGETGIYAEFSFEGALINSNIVDGAANGISIVNFNEGGRLAICSGNIVRNLSETGPYPGDPPGFGSGIIAEADTVVSGNVIENAPLYGIHVGWGEFMRNVVVTNNVVRKAAEGVAVTVVEGTGPAVITENLFEDMRIGAVFGHRWTKRVTGDLARTGSGGIDRLTVERNRSG